MEQIGPMKKFRNKKAMWTRIQQDKVEKIGRVFTETHIENRYKTVKNKQSIYEKQQYFWIIYVMENVHTSVNNKYE